MNKKNKNHKKLWIGLIVVLIVAVVAFMYFINNLTVQDVTTTDFFRLAGITLVDENDEIKYKYEATREIDKVVFNSYNVAGYKNVGTAEKPKYVLLYESSYGRNTDSVYFGDGVTKKKQIHFIFRNAIHFA